MIQLLLAVVCAMLFLLTLAVRRVYYCVPVKELKRLARERDQVGSTLYKVVAFDGSLAALLWLLAGTFAGLSFALFATKLPLVLAVIAVMALLWLGFSWVASSFPRSSLVRFTAAISPGLAWILSHAHVLLEGPSKLVRRHRRVLDHTGLYEKQDMLELVSQQKTQIDSRITKSDLALIERVLAFSDKSATDILTPRKAVRTVRINETIGPKLMDELHKTGQPSFLVTDEAEERIVGSVRLEDLVKARQGGTVKTVADETAAYVRDDFSLPQLLDAFRDTKQSVLAVINNAEEFLGIVTIDNLLGQLVDQEKPEDLTYTDRSAVAQYQPPEPPQTEPADKTAEDTKEAPKDASKTAEKSLLDGVTPPQPVPEVVEEPNDQTNEEVTEVYEQPNIRRADQENTTSEGSEVVK